MVRRLRKLSPAWLALGLVAGLWYALAGLLSGEPIAWWPLAVASPAGLMAVALAASRRGRYAKLSAALGAMLGALPMWSITHAWIMDISALGYPPGMLLQASWAGAFVLAASLALRGTRPPLAAAATLAVLWSAVEVARGQVLFGGYPWLLVGHPLIDAPRVSLAGAVVGAYGVGFAAALSTAAVIGLALGVLQRERIVGCVALIAVPWLALALLGLLAPPVGEAPGGDRGIRAGIVQTNVPQSNRTNWDIERQIDLFARFVEMTRQLGGEADVIVWPETMLPGPPIGVDAVRAMRDFGLYYETERGRLNAWSFAEELAGIQGELGVPMLVGAASQDGLEFSRAEDGSIQSDYDALHNSVHLFSDGRLTSQRYDKMRLTIFGEVIPLVSRWGWLERQLSAIGASGMTFDLDAAPEPSWIDVPLAGGDALRVATPICFEIAYEGVCRRLATGGGDRVDALVNATNDGWMGDSDAARATHMQLARWRALELGVPIVRAANTGISAILDARGRPIGATAWLPEAGPDHEIETAGYAFATRTPAIVAGAIPGRTVRPTPYAAAGWATPYVLLAAGGVLLVRGSLRARAGRTAAA
ncbi:MAG: apolipoprotein N-acyltransferase [Planctomycetota bacterium]